MPAACTGARVLAIKCMGHLDATMPGGLVVGPDHPCRGDLLPQAMGHGLRQHQRAILAPLAGPHDEGAALEVHVLDAQLQGLGDAHAGTVEQGGQQAVLGRLQRRQQALHFNLVQNHRKAAPGLGAADLGHPGQILAEHLLVEEQQRRERLPVRGRRHLALVGQAAEKGLHLGAAHLRRMPTALVKAHKCAHPVDVGLFGAQAVVQVAHPLTHLIQQTRVAQRRQRPDHPHHVPPDPLMGLWG